MKIKNITGSVTLFATLLASQFTYAKTEIVFSHYLPKDYVAKMVTKFEKQNPDIDINAMSCGFRDCHDKLTTALAVGEGAPDVVSISTIKLGSFVNAGGLTDLSVAPYNISDTGWVFDQSMLTLSENKQGDIFGVPFDTGPVVMVYRKDLVDSVGANIEDVTKNWDSFIAFAEQIKKKKGAYILPAATSLINPLVMGTNSQPGQPVYLKDGEPNLASDEIKGLVKLVKELYDKGLVAALDGSSNDQKFIKLFREGKLFADIDGPWIEGRILQEYDPEGAKSGLWRVSGIPNNTNVNAGGTVFAIPKQSQHKSEAWKFIQFLMQKDNVLDIAKIAGTLPARMEVYSDKFFDQPSDILGGQHSMKYYTEIVKNIKPYSASPVDNIANSILNDAIKKIVAQNADVDRTLEAANKLLKRRMRTL
ncbi:ABC transporter substrate-binding protein [Vibrio salinus]|uniref:ABC transporter substrate-binding protein n=1 Tax=Vibrio salinus TaxID=2899784 RepID=UPI001E5281FD|nr:extracellular solute-binding protein [Vibrio salinus]MCE0496224.1 extracellular solute-binding protein [Vibrio salinus]